MSRRTLATYNLKHAIIRETRDAAGEEHEEELKPEGFCVVLKRPRGKDMRIMDRYPDQEIAGSFAMLAKISNLSDEEIDLADMADLEELGNLLGKVEGSGQKTGPTA
ncbi:MAG: phage tail assembly protein [Novosphingobium sp.]